MAAVDQRSDQGRASIGHVLAASFVAGAVSVVAFASFVSLVGWAQRSGPPRFPSHLLIFAPLLGGVALIFVAPVHLFAMRILVPLVGRFARFAFLLPITLIALFPFVMASGMTTSYTPFDAQAMAMTLAAGAPAALAFHLAVLRKYPPTGNWVLAAIAVFWLVVLEAGQFGVPLTQRVRSHPLAARDHVLTAWYHLGPTVVLASGLVAFIFWHARFNRIAAATLLTGIALPLAFAGWYFAVPLGDGYAHFDLGRRVVRIDWRREPYTYNGGLNFTVADLEPYRLAGRHTINKTLRVQPAIGPLYNEQAYGKLPAAGRENWGLTCYNIDFRGRSISLCGGPGPPENWTSQILIEKGYIFISFDHEGVRYGLHGDVPDASKWREIRHAAILALDAADMSRK